MIIRDTPIDKENYVMIEDTDIAFKLQKHEFYPKYIDKDGLYFAKSTELDMALNKIKGGL